MSLSRNVTGREFQRHGSATEKLLSPRRVRVLLVAHVKTSADCSDRRTYARPPNIWTEMYAGRVACCPLASHVEYAPRAMLMLEKRCDRQTDGRQTNVLR